MKYFLSIIIALISLMHLQAREASLQISLQDSSFFVCEIRGKSYDRPQQELIVQKLQPGLCKVKIEKLMKRSDGNTIRVEFFTGDVFLEEGFFHHFVLNNENEMILSNKYELTARSNSRQVASVRTRPHISEARFQEELNLLRAIGPEKRRYHAAMQMISTRMITSSQINRMLTLFERPRLKMKLVEFGRIYVCDPQNYQTVVNNFYLRD
jgi:hypothetical protein